MKTITLLQIIFFLSLFLTMKAQSQLTISGPTVVCDDVSTRYVKYEVDSTSGNYNWSLPQGMTIVSGQGTHKIMVGVDYSFINGQVSVSKTNGVGNVLSSSLNVDILPKEPVFGNIKLHAEFIDLLGYVSTDIIVSYSVENTASTFIWTAPYGSVIIEGQNTSSVKIKFSQSFVGGDIEVVAENNCGVSTTSMYKVDIRSLIDNTSADLLGHRRENNSSLYYRTLSSDIAFHENLTNATFRDTVKGDDDYYFEVVLQNFSQNTMDSFYIKYYLSSNPNSFVQKMVAPLGGGEATTLPVLIIPTTNLNGTNELIIELNPDRRVLETDYTNNTLTVPFFVRKDVVSSNDILGDSNIEMINFPNPVIGMTTFSVKLDRVYSNVDIQVYDVSGRLVKTIGSVQGSGKEFMTTSDLSELSNGVYYWRVIAENQIFNSNSVIKVSR